MKKLLGIFLSLALLLGLAACGASAATEIVSPSASAEASAVVTFADPVLESRVRAAMGRPEGDITVAEAEVVTEMYLGIEWQMDVSEETQITDLGGLEYFKNLQSLNLSSNAVTDISPLAGLTKLTSLSLSGNPVADISPLSGMTGLEKLSLSGCTAQDYSPLESLASLTVLILDDSAITDVSALSGLAGLTYLSITDTQVSDVSPLSGLIGLKQLYLSGCPVTDYSPLADICANLEGKDFTIPSSLEELGFTKADDSVLASYTAESLSVTINHSEWGIPEMDMEADTIRISLDMDGGNRLTVGCDPAGNRNYVFSISQNGEHLTDYVYVTSEDSLMFDGDREAVENAIRAMLGDTGSGDILLAPISFFNDTIEETFGMTADALFALPFEPPTLLNLGFTADQENACYRYEQHDPWYCSIEVNIPEWGDLDGGEDVRFFTPVNGYGIVIYYFVDEQRFFVSADNQEDGSYAYFDFFVQDGSIIDGQSPEGMTVGEYFQNVYNDPETENVYLYSVQLMENYISDTFGMTITELYALPVGE